MQRCDAIDGLEDGLIDDPRRAISMPGATCRPVRRAPTPTAASRRAGRCDHQVYSGPVSRGRSLFPGFMPGSEAVITGIGGVRRRAHGSA